MSQDKNEWGYTSDEWNALHKSKRWRIKYPDRSRASIKKWAENNKEHRRSLTRKYHLKKTYGITQQQYDELLTLQKGKCAICETDKPTGKWKVFAVDHCHHTGKIRGLLCNECNRGMGLLRDSPDILDKARRYLLSYVDSEDTK